MAYFRNKQIKGQTYQYLVEGIRVDGKVKQRVVQYIGEPLSELEQNLLMLVHDGCLDDEGVRHNWNNDRQMFISVVLDGDPGPLTYDKVEAAFASPEYLAASEPERAFRHHERHRNPAWLTFQAAMEKLRERSLVETVYSESSVPELRPSGISQP